VVPANKTLIRAGLEALYFTGAHLVMQPLLGGIGAILTLITCVRRERLRSSPTACSR
jgi:hypothetical protein